MLNKKMYLKVTDDEKNIIIKGLVELRNSLIREGKYTDAVDEILIKILD